MNHCIFHHQYHQRYYHHYHQHRQCITLDTIEQSKWRQ